MKPALPVEVSDWARSAAALPLAFAQVREDPGAELWALSTLRPDARVLLVASGGCTAAAAAGLSTAARLHVVDPNPAQLALTRLKLRLLREEPAVRLAVLGHAPLPSAERRARLDALAGELEMTLDSLGPPPLLAERGPDHAGRYEFLFEALRRRLAGEGRAIEKLLRLRDPREQARLVSPTSPLGRALDAAFDEAMALPNLVALFGENATRNPLKPFARHFAERTRAVLGASPAADNPYLWQALAGRFPDGIVSPWLAAPVRAEPPEVEFTTGGMSEALDGRDGEFDLVGLSNILDWLDAERARALLEKAYRALRPGSWVLVRQLNSSLDIPGLGAGFEWLPGPSAALHAADRGYFYRALHAGRKR